MPPYSDTPSPETFKPTTPTKPYSHFKTIKIHLNLNPRTCLIISILFLQLSLLLISHYLIPLLYYNNNNTKDDLKRSSLELSNSSSSCELGRVYVYELPKEYNVDVVKSCDKLSLWGSRCLALSNNGFGLVGEVVNRIIPVELRDTWYWTDQFSSEILFHNRLLHHKCRTLDPKSATAYYIPFYAGLSVGKYLWNGSTVHNRDSHCQTMLNYLLTQHPYLNQSKGWNHFLIMGRITWDFRRSKDQDWGSKCLYLPTMRNITRLLIERNPWDYFDVGIPYPTGFHPNSVADEAIWQDFVRTRQRKSLFCFAGGTRGGFNNDFRGLLLNQCRESNGSCRLVNCGGGGARCGNGTSAILETFLDSEFCLQPRGDSFTRRSIFDCMIAGSIPVFFWRRSAYYQYEWFLPNDPKSYSVFIHRDEVKNGTLIKNVLEKFTKDEVKRMRDKVVEFIPKFVYAKPNEGLESVKDAVDIAVDGVLRRIKEQKENNYDW